MSAMLGRIGIGSDGHAHHAGAQSFGGGLAHVALVHAWKRQDGDQPGANLEVRHIGRIEQNDWRRQQRHARAWSDRINWSRTSMAQQWRWREVDRDRPPCAKSRRLLSSGLRTFGNGRCSSVVGLVRAKPQWEGPTSCGRLAVAPNLLGVSLRQYDRPNWRSRTERLPTV